jgi:hypothetical protein
MPPNQNPQSRCAGQGYILFLANGMVTAFNVTERTIRKYNIATLPEGLWLLADRGLAIGQKREYTLCVLCDLCVSSERNERAVRKNTTDD